MKFTKVVPHSPFNVPFKTLFKDIPEEEWCIAGGAVRSCWEQKHSGDVDVFVFKRSTFDLFRKLMPGYREYKTNLLKGSIGTFKVDVILEENSSPEEVVSKFDFTVCCAYFYKGEYFVGENTIEHIIGKQLHINKITTPKASLRRIAQYGAKGYTVSEELTEEFIDEIKLNDELDLDTFSFTGNTGFITYQETNEETVWIPISTQSLSTTILENTLMEMRTFQDVSALNRSARRSQSSSPIVPNSLQRLQQSNQARLNNHG